MVTPAIVQRETRNAPAQVRQLYAEIAAQAELVPTTVEVEEFAVAYLNAGIVPGSSEVDALHIALATASACDLLISWNFTHLVNFYRLPRYNAVYTLYGDPAITIQSPPRVLRDEDERV